MKTITKFVFFVVLSITANIASAASSKIGILVFDGFLTSDVTAPIEVFGAATKKSWFSSYEVVVISATEDKTVISEEGLKVVADQTIYDTIELDVLLVPSAYDMGDYIGNDNLISFIEKQGASASWMASNCSGAFLLGEAGILDGKKATTWAGGEKDLAMSYPKINVQYDQNVVIDGNVITSNGGPVSYQAAFELLAKLSSEKFANEISESIQFNRLDRAFRP
ncbi:MULTISPECIES: DJ-1/PfpI family protein [Enterovibrio]|uniref:Transcriptional regulator n=1 Tax=Enterovibrio norvegicus FF-454 TaxID=1185651 RepID=A0A1E5C4C2_9GAMM|nr:DJ-1/PfpI family protein [Enterovibrio norvegicus]OEE60346.1 transcriptional regulator [Enterovibrio norvegicus FF-454]